MRLFQHFTSAVVASAAAVLVTCLTGSAEASSRARNPLNYLSVIEAPLIHTPSKRVHAHSSFDLTFDIHNHAQHIRLALEPNHDILADDAQVVFVDKYGNERHSEKIDRQAHKVFQGKAFVVDDKHGRSTHVGWARITVRRDGVKPLFTGAFSVMGDHHNIMLSSNYMSTKHVLDPDLEEADDEYMVMWRNSDVSRQSFPADLERRSIDTRTCGSDELSFNSNPNHPVYRGLLKRDDGHWGAMSVSNLFGKRQSIDGGGAGNGGAGVNLRNSIGSTTGCPKTRKVALIGIATDCGYSGAFNSTESLRANVIDIVNTASDLYQSTFNITLGLRNLTISDAECPTSASSQTPWNAGCSDSTTMTTRLTTFSAWRGQWNDSNAYWSLWTTCNTGAEIGLAWLGQLCSTGSTAQSSSSSNNSVTGANVVARTSTEWQVFAHETGHTFGAVHDCDSTTCADSTIVDSNQCCPLSTSTCDADAKYIMNPYAEPGLENFSPCTIGNICGGLGSNSVVSTCLTDNKDVRTITGQQCGNGIVEDGEDCDCGGEDGCSSDPCCDAKTCKFTSGSVCDPTNESCCTSKCQFSAQGTVCRASTGQCDPQEVCSGTNGTCPADQTTPDGTSCGTNLQCASGQCTSRDLQCKTAMGSYTHDNNTYACDSETCTLSCASPAFGENVCYTMQQNFLDGTSCGGGGKCSNGVCKGSTVGGTVRSWIHDNKTLVIALASALGSLLVIAVLMCCVRACCVRRPRGGIKAAATAAAHSRYPRPGQRGAGMSSWDGPSIPEPMQRRGYGDHGWDQPPPPPPPPRAGPSGWGHPSQPPPVYSAVPPPVRQSPRYA